MSSNSKDENKKDVGIQDSNKILWESLIDLKDPQKIKQKLIEITSENQNKLESEDLAHILTWISENRLGGKHIYDAAQKIEKFSEWAGQGPKGLVLGPALNLRNSLAEFLQRTGIHPAESAGAGAEGKETRRIPPFTDFAKFWAAFCRVDLTKVTNVISLKDAFLMGDDVLGSALFIRKSYKELYELILTTLKGRRGMVLEGNPGIGKSLFALYMCLRIVQELRVPVIYQHNKNGWFFLLQGNGEVAEGKPGESFRAQLHQRDAFYIFDAGGPGEPMTGYPCMTLCVTSPDSSHYHEFEKSRKAQLLMPVWSKAEILECLPLVYPDLPEKYVKTQYVVWGGLPRYVFDKDQVGCNRFLEKFIKNFDIELLSKSAGNIAEISRESAKPGFNSLVLYRVGSDYQSQGVRFCSKYVRRRIMAKYSFYEVNKLVSFVKSGTGIDQKGSEQGHAFELLAHAALSQGGKFETRRLQTGKSSTETLKPLDQLYFNSVADIGTQKNNKVYMIPVSKTFAAFDSIIPPSTAFQITVNPGHTVSRKGCHEVLRELGVKPEKLRIYIATVPDRFLAFTKNMAWKDATKHKDFPPSDQYVLKVDLDRIKGFQMKVEVDEKDFDEDEEDGKDGSKDSMDVSSDQSATDGKSSGMDTSADTSNSKKVHCTCSKSSGCKTVGCECKKYQENCDDDCSCSSSKCSRRE